MRDFCCENNEREGLTRVAGHQRNHLSRLTRTSWGELNNQVGCLPRKQALLFN
ncbi:unnamed protein product [marine sediment metagenome]|uniref:Uncharacterized protein n=1 Tax=marine sediment metagenome TaxID=412755 RepID=X1J3J0_9ZZZZ